MEASLPPITPSPADPGLRRCDGLLVLALGSNRDRPRHRLAHALRRLADHLGPLRVAPLYLTAPISTIEQEPFLNTVALVRRPVPDGDRIAPEARRLLTLAKTLEAEAGRVDGPRDGPRPLDVDLILWGATEMSLPALADEPAGSRWFKGPLRLPHPRFRQRRFVLAPLADLAPNLCFPDGASVRELLIATAEQQAQEVSWRPIQRKSTAISDPRARETDGVDVDSR